MYVAQGSPYSLPWWVNSANHSGLTTSILADALPQGRGYRTELIATAGVDQRVRGPREFRHTLETLVNGMIELGLNVVKVREFRDNDSDAVLEPGTWEHFKSIAPPYLTFWSVYRGG